VILAIVGVVHAYDLLPYYLSHYRKLGVDRFAVACNPKELDREGDLKRTLALQADVDVCSLPRGFRRSNLVGMIEEEVRQRIATPDDWVIPADLDELNQYPEELHELTEKMRQHGFTHVTGKLRDRLARSGVLTALKPFERSVSIWEQYPLEADVTARITQGSTKKVLLSRGDLGWTAGHHRMRPSPLLKPFPSTGVAHHFKWRDGLAQTLTWRVQNEERARAPWSHESARLSDYLRERGRIALDDVNTTTGWCAP
jgi:hypothetical protein